MEDLQFLERLESETKLVDGQYEMPLQFKKSMLHKIPENRTEALADAFRFRARLNRGTVEDKQKVVKFMNNMESKGYSEKAPEGEGKLYITYHQVKHPKKPEKVRVVFNCAKKFDNVCLNDLLISGPDLCNNLVGDSTRWRQGEECFTADIEDMFYRHRIPPEQRDYLRYFWWDNEDMEGQPVEMCMNVHIFGATSSPACSNFALRRCAEDNKTDFPPEAVEALKSSFYVDDLCQPCDDVDQGKELAKAILEITKRGGFNLTKFLATDSRILDLIPEKNRAGMRNEIEQIGRVLGQKWSISKDELGFEIELTNRPCTKRGLLSSLCTVYDPMGLISPYLLHGRRILQELCNSKLGWDEPVEEEVLPRWQTWCEGLNELSNLKLSRCYKPKGFGKPKSAELHVFSDASEVGYGAAAYIRLENENGEICVSLVMGKSRVIPLSGETVARSELVAATLASELGLLISTELTYRDLKVYRVYNGPIARLCWHT